MEQDQFFSGRFNNKLDPKALAYLLFKHKFISLSSSFFLSTRPPKAALLFI